MIAPVFHNQEAPADAVRTTELPAHTLLSPKIWAAVGEAVKVIIVGSSMDSPQLFIKVLPSVPVTMVSVYTTLIVTAGEMSIWIW